MSEENTDLENEESKTFTQEQVNEMIQQAVEKEVTGLKENNQKLLGEKKAAQLEREEQEEQARLAREEAAKKSGDIEAIERSMKERHDLELKQLQEKLSNRDSLILGGKKEALVNDLAGDFLETSKDLGKTILNTMVEVSYNEDGKPQTTFKDQAGNLLSTDINVFKEHLKTSSAFQPLLKGVQMNGGGRRSDNGASGAKSQTNNAAEDAKKRGDVAGFLNAKMKNKT